MAGDGDVEVVDVAGVVLVVVEMHGFGVNIGLEGVVGVGKWREGEGTGGGGRSDRGLGSRFGCEGFGEAGGGEDAAEGTGGFEQGSTVHGGGLLW